MFLSAEEVCIYFIRHSKVFFVTGSGIYPYPSPFPTNHTEDFKHVSEFVHFLRDMVVLFFLCVANHTAPRVQGVFGKSLNVQDK